MLLFLLIIFIIANFLVACYKKVSNHLVFATSLFIILVFVGSRDVADSGSYINYYSYGSKSEEMGSGQFVFAYFTDLCRYLGFSFDIYRLLLSSIGMFCYYLLISRCCPLPNLVFAAYLSYLMIMDDIQIRNFVGCAVFCYALSFILYQRKNWRIYYFLILVIASFIHTSFWIYSIFLFVPSNLYVNSKRIIIFGLLAIGFSILVLFARQYLDNVVMLLSVIDKEKAQGYQDTEARFGGAIYGVINIFSTCCIYYIKKRIGKIENIINCSQKKYLLYSQFLQVIFLLDMLAMICIPPVIMALTFNRLIRNMYIINIVGFSIGFYLIKNKLIPILMIFIITYIYYYFDLSSEWALKEIIDPYFNNNTFF